MSWSSMGPLMGNVYLISIVIYTTSMGVPDVGGLVTVTVTHTGRLARDRASLAAASGPRSRMTREESY